MRLGESLIYDKDAQAAADFGKWAASYANAQSLLSGAALEKQKAEIIATAKAFAYLVKHNLVAAGFAPKADLDKIIKAQKWDEPPGKKKKS